MTPKIIKHIKIFPYDSNWPRLFEQEAMILEQILGKNCLAVHHIGSTSIPDLAAKEDLDILCVVGNLEVSLNLQEIGYIFKGELNIPLRYFFSKNTSTSKVNLHVVQENHGFIDLNLNFRNYLRAHPERRQDYQNLKYQLLQDPTSFERVNGRFPRYTLRKNDFIKETLSIAEYFGITFNFCAHDAEWEAAKTFRKTYLFNKIDDPYTWTFNHSDHVHLVMYQGTTIIGYAHIQLWPNDRAALRIIVIDPTVRSQGLGSRFLTLIETWLASKKYKSLHIESSAEALPFYRKHTYTDMPFNDPDGYESDPRDVPIGKAIVGA